MGKVCVSVNGGGPHGPWSQVPSLASSPKSFWGNTSPGQDKGCPPHRTEPGRLCEVGDMPLAFTQEGFLVSYTLVIKQKVSYLSYNQCSEVIKIISNLSSSCMISLTQGFEDCSGFSHPHLARITCVRSAPSSMGINWK